MSDRDDMQAEPWRFDFLATMRRLERDDPGRPRIGDSATPAEELVRLGQDPYMDFPASNLSKAEVLSDGRLRILVKFLGLLGPQGALPLATTEETLGWMYSYGDDAFPRFADLINSRFLQLFFRAWADSRPIAQHDRPELDRFKTYIGAMVGIGSAALQDLDTMRADFTVPEQELPLLKIGQTVRLGLGGDDKPFAGTSTEARELIGLAKDKGVILAPFHNRRWDGDFLTVRKLLEQEAVGRLVTFESHFDRFRPLPREGSWKETESDVNGLLMDLGPHLVDQALALFGVPEAITASVRRDRDETAIQDAFDIVLHYPRLLAYCRSSMVACDASPRFLLHGTRGSFKKFGLDPQEPALVAGEKVPPMGMGDWLPEDKSAWGTLTVAPNPADPGTLVRTVIETERGDYRNFYANVRNAINGAAPLSVATEEGYRVVKLLEMARQSSAEGRTLPVNF